MSRPVSIVVPTFNRCSMTRQFLDGLLGSDESRGCDIVVVDDCSTDDTPTLLDKYGDAIRTIRQPVNRGYGQAVNDGTAAARHGLIVQLNNDTIPQPGWLAALIQYAERNPTAAVVGSKLLNVDGSVQHAGMAFCSERRPWHLYRWFPAEHPAVHISRRFQAVTSACMLVRREAFVSVGGFDASYRNSYNDVDFCLRLTEKGREIHFCHESVLFHLEGASKEPRAGEEENRRRFHERWSDRIRGDEWDYYLGDGLIRIARHDDRLEILVDPALARVSGGIDGGRLDAVLRNQSRQIAWLLREYIALRMSSPECNSLDPPHAIAQPPRGDLRELSALAAKVLDHDGVVAERDALRVQRDGLVAMIERFRNSLPGRGYSAVRRLFRRSRA